MSNPFLRFEDGKISLGGKDLLVSSANLSISPSFQVERVYGDYDPDLVGAKTEFINFAPMTGLNGKLDISFYISAESFNREGGVNSIERLFEIKGGMSEDPIHSNVVGRYSFDNMYLTSFSFELQPFKIVKASASYIIYGSIRKNPSRRFVQLGANFAHGLKSFGQIKIGGAAVNPSSFEKFEINSLNYKIIVDRKLHTKIRESENTSINTFPDGVLPYRVSVESIESEMNVQCNDIVSSLNSYGDQQLGSSPEGLQDSEICAFLYSAKGERVAKFSSRGKIQSESISITEGSNASCNIYIKEIIK
jgi:hypothetical protein